MLEQNEADLNLANLVAAVSWLTEELMRSQRDMLTERNRYEDNDGTEEPLSAHGDNPAVSSLKDITVHSEEGISERQLSNGSATISNIGLIDSNRRALPKSRILAARALLEWALSRCTDMIKLEQQQKHQRQHERGQEWLKESSSDEDDGGPSRSLPDGHDNGKRLWINGCLSSLIHSLGRVRHFDSRLVQGAEACLAENQLRRCSTHELANIAWGFARLSHRPSRAWVRKHSSF